MSTDISSLESPALAATPSFEAENWGAAFAGAARLEMKQASFPADGARWRPCTVSLGGTPGKLWILADLADDDAFGSEVPDQSFFYEHCDVFEIFIQPGGQPSYFEFHVSPANQRLSLRWPSPETIRELRSMPDPTLDRFKWELAPLNSRVRLVPGHGWQVLVELDLAALKEGAASAEPWLFSFSRYDYTRGSAKPVLSSTSEHTKLDFHRVDEWTPIAGVEAFLP